MKFLSQEVADTRISSAIAWMFPVIGQVVAIVKRQFFSGGDGALSHYDKSAFLFNRTIRRTGVVQKTRGIGLNVPVQVELLIQVKDECIPFAAAPDRLSLRDSFP